MKADIVIYIAQYRARHDSKWINSHILSKKEKGVHILGMVTCMIAGDEFSL
jgi:hypothetical protein